MYKLNKYKGVKILLEIEVDTLERDCISEYNKFSLTQKELVDDFMKVMSGVVEYERNKQKNWFRNLFKKKNRKEGNQEVNKLMKENSLTQVEMFAVRSLVFELRGVQINVVDFSIIKALIEDAKNMRTFKVDPGHFSGSVVKDIILRYEKK